MSLSSSSTTSTVAALTILVVAVVALILASTGQASSADVSGVLEVNNTRYEFVPTACTATDTDFVAAGSGTAGDHSFWVSASGRAVTLKVGTDSEVERPSDDQLWMTSIGTISWEAADGAIDVSGFMVDGRRDNSPHHRAELSIICPDA